MLKKIFYLLLTISFSFGSAVCLRYFLNSNYFQGNYQRKNTVPKKNEEEKHKKIKKKKVKIFHVFEKKENNNYQIFFENIPDNQNFLEENKDKKDEKIVDYFAFRSARLTNILFLVTFFLFSYNYLSDYLNDEKISDYLNDEKSIVNLKKYCYCKPLNLFLLYSIDNVQKNLIEGYFQKEKIQYEQRDNFFSECQKFPAYYFLKILIKLHIFYSSFVFGVIHIIFTKIFPVTIFIDFLFSFFNWKGKFFIDENSKKEVKINSYLYFFLNIGFFRLLKLCLQFLIAIFLSFFILSLFPIFFSFFFKSNGICLLYQFFLDILKMIFKYYHFQEFISYFKKKRLY